MIFLLEITKQNRVDDIYIEFDNKDDAIIYLSQNGFMDDGYRIIQYNEGVGGSLRVGSKALFRSYVEVELNNAEVEFNTLAEAISAGESLNDSDGYDIIDLEQPIGSAASILIESRPSLWDAAPVASRENGWGRTDNDRF